MEEHVIIPKKKLHIWKIFSDPGPEGDKILKTAKLAHAKNEKEGFVVTIADQTYYFFRDDGGGVKITRVPELCGVRVKEFIMGSISLALTEDGRLYSWLCPDAVSQKSSIIHPVAVSGSLTGKKVVQVASSDGCVLALTSDGDVHHWLWQPEPTLIAGEKFDNKKVISVAGNGYLKVVLTVDGELFEWKWFGSSPQKSALSTSSPVMKIAASKSTIFALTVDGMMHSWTFSASSFTAKWDPVWLPSSNYKNVKNIATCGTEDVSVCFGCYVGTAPLSAQFFTKSASLDESFAQICQTSYRTIWVAREPEREPRKVGDDIANL
ncbi:uncharacterized protein LOC118432879 [Folsomia candida]|uniref:uncharacterized protein LOC118432879 n=1 Tax=Folsomia candida TaxID=158441 RepID=UPI001604A54C|nr:uncharacterized protein LOC118432879 [Folsomia candida]